MVSFVFLFFASSISKYYKGLCNLGMLYSSALDTFVAPVGSTIDQDGARRGGESCAACCLFGDIFAALFEMFLCSRSVNVPTVNISILISEFWQPCMASLYFLKQLVFQNDKLDCYVTTLPDDPLQSFDCGNILR
jgi:hypothetical protein